jgi:diaminopimelate decarboxylase
MTHFRYHDGTLLCDGVEVPRLMQQHGTPLYLYSRDAITERCREILDACGDARPLVCYAVKANANLEILKIVAAQGLGADVGSGGELHLALRAGFAPSTITFSGVGKQDDEIARAIDAGILAFNIESRQELEAIEAVAAARGVRARVLLRVNLDIDAGGHRYISTSLKHNKFGVPWHHAEDELAYAMTLPHIEVRGIHSHIGSQITKRDVFHRAARRIVGLVRELRASGIPMEDLDFGGGFAVRYHGFLEDPALPAEPLEGEELTAPEAIRSIIPVLRESGCRLSFQPGRSIVAQAGILAVTVLYRKQMDRKVFVIVDGGMNDLIRPSLYNSHHQIVPTRLTGAPHETADVVGPVCESGDFFAQDRPLPRVQRGEGLAIMCAGAYGFVLSSNYNARLRPAEVLVEGETARLVRARETYADL